METVKMGREKHQKLEVKSCKNHIQSSLQKETGKKKSHWDAFAEL